MEPDCTCKSDPMRRGNWKDRHCPTHGINGTETIDAGYYWVNADELSILSYHGQDKFDAEQSARVCGTSAIRRVVGKE